MISRSRAFYEQRNGLPAVVDARQYPSGGTVVSAKATELHNASARGRSRARWADRARIAHCPRLEGATGPQMCVCESVTRSNEYSDTPIVRYRRRVLPVSPPNCLILGRMADGGAPDGRCAKGYLWAGVETHRPYIAGGEAGWRWRSRAYRHPRHHCLHILL